MSAESQVRHSERPWLDDSDVELYLGDATAVLKTMPNASVDAIVTSPPYGDQRAYGGADPSLFVPWIEPVLAECLRVLKTDGSMVLNLGRIEAPFSPNDEIPGTIEDAVAILRAALGARDE